MDFLFEKILAIPFIYNSRRLLVGIQLNTRKFILENYRKHKCHSVVDFGCGTGEFSDLFSTEEYLGIDINPAYINFAKKNVGYQYLHKDILNESIKLKKVDSLILISVLHHLSDKEIKKIMDKLIPFITKLIIIVDLNPKTDPIRKFLINRDRGIFVRTKEEKLKVLSRYGKIVRLENFNTGLAAQTGIVIKIK